MITFNFKIKFSLYVVLAFIVFTVVGTLTHELGHIAVAKYFGYKTYLSYGSMYYVSYGYEDDIDTKELKKLNKDYLDKGVLIPEDLDDKSLKYNNSLNEKIQHKFPENKRHSLLISIGGPAQTILTCFIGLLILFIRKSKERLVFQVSDWLGVFLSLFILREVFNTVMATFTVLFSESSQFYGDEFRISRLLGLNQWVIPILTLIIGLAISTYIIFKVIPLQQRFSFIISGLIGGVLGFLIWFGFLGQLVFPTSISF